MPLWYKDYFELKAVEKWQTQEELSALPDLPKSSAYIFLSEDFPLYSLTPGRRTDLTKRGRDNTERAA